MLLRCTALHVEWLKQIYMQMLSAKIPFSYKMQILHVQKHAEIWQMLL